MRRLAVAVAVPLLLVGGCSSGSEPAPGASASGAAGSSAAVTGPDGAVTGPDGAVTGPDPASAPAGSSPTGAADGGQGGTATPSATSTAAEPGGVGGEGGTSRYANSRYDFSVDVPVTMTALEGPANGDGSTFLDGSATLTVSGANNSDGRPTLEQAASSLADNGARVTGRTGGADDFTITAETGSDVQRTRYLVGEGSHVVAQWVYPKAEASRYDQVAARSLESLQARGLADPH